MSRFLLVSLNIKAILQEATLHRRREKLSAMTGSLGLGNAYDVTIGRIKAQEGGRVRLGMAALMWISYSERPLNVDEICHALAVEIGSTDININNIPSIRTVLGCCQGLAAVDKGSSTIRLIHFTLKEYLSRHADLFDTPHSRMAETCLTYLNFRAIRSLSASLSHGLRDTPLLEYSSLYWGTHMRMEVSDRSRHLALHLLDQYHNHISAKLLWKSAMESYPKSLNLKPFSALHCISYFGIAEVALDLIRMRRWDVNQKDSAGQTPLIWAARYGREEVVRLLLQQKDIQSGIEDTEHGRTALSWAAGSGNEGVVGQLLGPLSANGGSIGCWWRKISQAMSVQSETKYTSLSRLVNSGRTPLSWAAEHGHDGVVKLLLEWEDGCPCGPDIRGRTPLWWAAQGGNDGVVKLLLEREGFSSDGLDYGFQLPLLSAAKHGHDGVVKLLLEREDVSPDRPDNDGRTPLSWAVLRKSDGVVKLLLGREEVNSNILDCSGRTLLSHAAELGNGEAVKLLLGREDVSPDRPDNDGRTPLSWAVCSRGRDRPVKLLLEREDVNPNSPDHHGRTPLSRAAEEWNYKAVELLLERENIYPDRPDNDGRTPLSWAVCCRGKDRAMKLLLERKDVYPDRPDNHGLTPLSWAAKEWNYEAMKLLLEREGVCHDRPDDDGRTPLSQVAGIKVCLGLWEPNNGMLGVVDRSRQERTEETPAYWRNKIVELLLDRRDVSPDRLDNYGQTPLLWAAGCGNDGVVELLLGQEDVNPDRSDCRGRTPFWWAVRYGQDEVVRLLLGREDVNPNRLDNFGEIPLSPAAQNGHAGVVKLLLGLGDVSPDRPNNDGQTPLSLAACGGHDAVMKLLLGREDVNPDRSDRRGRTPLWWAAWHGHGGAAKLPKAGKRDGLS